MVIIFFLGQIFFYIDLLKNKSVRKDNVVKSSRIEELRNKRVKSLEEQKEFTQLLYPKKAPFKFTFQNLGKVFLRALGFLALFIITISFWNEFVGYEFNIFTAIITFLLYPILSDYVLRKFGFQQKNILDVIGRNCLK